MNLNKEGLKSEDKTCTILQGFNIRKWKLNNVKKGLHVQHGVISKYSPILYKKMIVVEEMEDQDEDCEDQIIQRRHLEFL